MTRVLKVAPSLLSADFAKLGKELERLTTAGADWIHIDVMDGHFVPNMTIGPHVVKQLRPYTSLPFDVHLMVEKVDTFLKPFADAGADYLTIHPETTLHLHRSLQTIHALGKKAGVALNPATSPEILKYVLDEIDLVLVMTVNPGFGGQRFIQSQLEKIRLIHHMIADRMIDIAVDGGITLETAPEAIAAGASVLVSGTTIFKDGHYRETIAALKKGLRE
jgi:ribulose-phosphate 3-epimerase